MKRITLFLMALSVGAVMGFTTATAQNATVKFKTSKAVGDTITITVNHTYTGITIDWGDGNAETYNTGKDALREVTGQVKGDSVIISGDSDLWNTLICPDCGITGIDLSDARQLQSLYLQDNELTRVDLRKMTNLTDLDLARNNITDLLYTSRTYPERDLESIENLNLSDNELKGTFVMRTATLQNLDISGNNYTAINTNSNTNLDKLNCSNNSISTLSVATCDSISTLVCHDNNISKFSLPDDISTLQQFICDNNSINNSFDMTNCTRLIDLSIANNQISELTMPENKKYNSLNLSGNKLTLAVLPKPSYKPDYIQFTPQATIDISGLDNIKTNESGPYAEVTTWAKRKVDMLDLSSYAMLAVTNDYKGYNGATIEWYYLDNDSIEHPMELGTSSSQSRDYYKSSNKFTFFAEHPKAFARITATSGSYANDSIFVETSVIAIGENAVVGINDAVVTPSALTVVAGTGSVAMTCTEKANVSIFTTDGTIVWNGSVGNSTTTVALPAGIYIIAGKKYYVK